MHKAKVMILAIAADKRLVLHGFILLGLHITGALFLYDLVPEFDNLPHFWFGYVLSEYSSKGATSIGLQNRLGADHNRVDFLIRLVGFLLVGGLLWESAELFLSPVFGIKPDSFFAFPVTLRNIDGALDVTIGAIGASVAFLIKRMAQGLKST